MAAQLCTEIVAIMLAATLLEREHPFISMILNLPLGLLCLVAIFMLRSDKDSQKTSAANDEDDSTKEPADFVSSVRRSLRTLPQLFHNRYLLVLLFTVPVAKMLNPVMELMFQYIPRKFDVSLAWVCFPPSKNLWNTSNIVQTSRIFSIQAFESLIFLIVVLPLAKRIAQTRFHLSSKKVDLSIAQYGFMVMVIGCFIMACAQSLLIFILGELDPSLAPSNSLTL
jgi:hypothetical protein